MATPPRLRWFQFSLRGLLIATFWAAVFCSALALLMRLLDHELFQENEDYAYITIGLVLFVSLSASVGGLFGRARWGAAAGIVLFLLYVGWMAFAINTWAGL
jgi:hypothetical protein